MAHDAAAPWKARGGQVGWVLLPLRIFLGVTLVYAGLLKFFDPAYLDPTAANGVQRQMEAAAGSSPIGFLVSFTADHAALFGLTIAFGELAVGLGVLLGLWTRIAAVGGFLLSLSFFLTVSWGTSPYFFGPDIVFMFAFTPLIIGGDGGLYSLGRVIHDSTRRRMRLAVPPPAHESAAVTADVDRRAVLRTGAVAAAIGVGALLAGGLGRIVAGSNDSSVAADGSGPSGSSGGGSNGTSTASGGAPSAGSNPAASGKPKGGVRIAQSANVPVGSAKSFTDPSTNAPAYLLQPKAGVWLAYTAVCTHQGCTVGFDQAANEFACPCHGARFDGSNGDVVRGPAQRPLSKINVVEANGNVYVV